MTGGEAPVPTRMLPGKSFGAMNGSTTCAASPSLDFFNRNVSLYVVI